MASGLHWSEIGQVVPIHAMAKQLAKDSWQEVTQLRQMQLQEQQDGQSAELINCAVYAKVYVCYF